MEYYSMLTVNELSSQRKIWRKGIYIFINERNQSEKAPLPNDSKCMTFLKWQNYGDSKKD